MKHLFVILLGLFVGATAAVALLYYNPLTLVRPFESDRADRALHYELPEHSLAFMHGDRALLPGTDVGDEQFWEETISRTALLALSLNDAGGLPTAAASRLIQASSDTDLLLRGVLISDHWLLTIPGEGSLFLRVDTNLWPFLRQSFIPTWYLGRPWKGPADYQPTVGPGPRSAVVVGATGNFANLQGSAVEHYRLTTLDPMHGAVALAGEIRLYLFEPTVSGEQIATSE
jgi:hypothetical protein